MVDRGSLGGENTVEARIGKSVVIVGDVVASEDLIVDGHVKGRIDVRGHHLTIAPNAQIESAIVARMITIQGSVTGDVAATETIDVRETGVVDGSLTAPRLGIRIGAHVCGRVDTKPVKGTSINDSASAELTHRFAVAI